MSSRMIKRLRKFGSVRTVLCAETRNKCFGRVVYEELETGDFGVIVDSATGSDFVDIDTFIKIRQFWDSAEWLEAGTAMKMFVYGTDDLVSARRLDVVARGRGVWESLDGEWYVAVMTAGGQYFMPLADFMIDYRSIERAEACCCE